MIESKKEKAEQKRNKIFKVDESCAKIQEVVNVKRKVQIKESNHFNDWKYKKVRLKEAETIETGTEKTETCLRRSSCAETIQFNMTLNATYQEGVKRKGDRVDCEGLR